MKAYRVFKKHTKSIMKSINVNVNDVQTEVISHEDEHSACPSQNVVQDFLSNEANNLQPAKKDRDSENYKDSDP